MVCGGDFNANPDKLVGFMVCSIFTKFMQDCGLKPTNQIIASDMAYTYSQETVQRYRDTEWAKKNYPLAKSQWLRQ